AYGAAKIAGTDIGVSTTGVARPNGGTEEKPVGLVYVCVYYKEKFNVLKIRATGSRDIVRERASTSVLDLIRSSIED
ncbi:MAG: CinA family protein, partial [Sedimentibacter sp.]